jgi:hypothetical protein
MDIAIEKFKTWPDWRNAPVGSVLLIKADSNAPTKQDIVLRIVYRDPARPDSPGYVALQGPQMGQLRHPSASVASPVIDISDLVEFRLQEAFVVPVSHLLVDSVGIYAKENGAPLLFVSKQEDETIFSCRSPVPMLAKARWLQ